MRKSRLFNTVKIFLFPLAIFLSSPAEGKIVFELEFPPAGSKPSALEDEPKIGLVLGGGGARGAAHIGVLEVLEENGISIGAVAGVSFGALVGGLYSCGYSARDVRELVLSLDWESLLSGSIERRSLPIEEKKRNDVRLFELSISGWNIIPPLGLSSGQRFAGFLDIYTTPANYSSRFDFDSLDIPFRAVATDLVSGKPYPLSKGSLSLAIQASLAIPVLFSPVEYEEKFLVDGTLSDPLPVDLLREMGVDIVIGVDVSPLPLAREDIRSVLDILIQSFSLSIREKILTSRSKVDILIHPVNTSRSMTDFHGLEPDIEQGRKAATEVLPLIERIVSEKKGDRVAPFRPYTLESIHVSGSSRIQEAEIISRSGLIIGEMVSAKRISEALTNIYSMGFFRRVTAQGIETSKGLSLTFGVDENFLVKEVRLDGVHSISHGEIMAIMETRGNTIFRREALEKDKKRIVSLYREKGYSIAEIKETSISEDEGVVRLVVNEGRVEDILLEGNEKTRDSVLLEKIQTLNGEAFNLNRTKGDIQRLSALGLFNRVSFELKEGKEGVVLVYKVMEKPQLLFGFAIRGDTDEGLAELTELRWDNFIGLGSRWSLRARTGERQEYCVGYFDRRTFGIPVDLDINGFFAQRERPLFDEGKWVAQFRERKYGGMFRVLHQLEEWGQISLEYLFARVEVASIFGGLPYRYPNERLGGLIAEFEVDDLDEKLFPASGKQIKTLLLAANQAFGGSRSFLKAEAELLACMSPFQGHTIGLSSGLGFGSPGIPLYERFTIGGMSYIPGYHQLIGYQREEFMGRHYVSIAPFYRTKLFSFQGSFLKALYWIFNAQVGGTWDDYDDIGSENFHPGGGIGLHLSTLFGSMRLDGGWGEAGRWELCFSAGYSF